MSNSFNRVLSKMPKATAKKANLKKANTRKVSLSFREDDISDAYGDFMTYRQDLDYLIKNQMPDWMAKMDDFVETVNNSEQGLNEVITLYKEVQSEYADKLNELGVNPDDIPAYGYIDTRIFEAEEQLELASEIKDKLNSISL